MTLEIFSQNSYEKSCEAAILNIDNEKVVMDKQFFILQEEVRSMIPAGLSREKKP